MKNIKFVDPADCRPLALWPKFPRHALSCCLKELEIRLMAQPRRVKLADSSYVVVENELPQCHVPAVELPVVASASLMDFEGEQT